MKATTNQYDNNNPTPGLIADEVLKTAAKTKKKGKNVEAATDTGAKTDNDLSATMASAITAMNDDAIGVELHKEWEAVDQLIELSSISTDETYRLRDHDSAAVERLAKSILELGQDVPVIVVDNGDGQHTLVDGFCRIAAFRYLEATGAPSRPIRALVYPYGTPHVRLLAVSATTLAARNDATPYQMAELVGRLRQQGMTQTRIARVIGKAQNRVSDLWTFWSLSSDAVKKLAVKGVISLNAIQPVYGIGDPEVRARLEEKVVKEVKAKGKEFNPVVISRWVESERQKIEASGKSSRRGKQGRKATKSPKQLSTTQFLEVVARLVAKDVRGEWVTVFTTMTSLLSDVVEGLMTVEKFEQELLAAFELEEVGAADTSTDTPMMVAGKPMPVASGEGKKGKGKRKK